MNTTQGTSNAQMPDTMTPWLPSRRGENLEMYFTRKFGEDWTQESFEEAYSELGQLLFTDFACYRVTPTYDNLHVKSTKKVGELPVVVVKGLSGEYSEIWTGEVELFESAPSSSSTDNSGDDPKEDEGDDPRENGSEPPSLHSSRYEFAPGAASLPMLPVGLNSISPHSVVVVASVNSVPVRCLMDTGASISLAPRSVAEKLHCKVDSCNMEALSASGHIIELKECARVRLEIAGVGISATINFVDDSKFTVSRDYGVIIGGDVFEKLPPIEFDYVNRIFSVGGSRVSFGQRSLVLMNNIRMASDRDVTVPPDTQLLIDVQIESDPVPPNAVVVDRTDPGIAKRGLAAINCVLPAGIRKMKIPIVNPTTAPVKLWKGTHVAFCNEVACDDQCCQ